MSKGLDALEKLNKIQKVFEKLAYWAGYDLSKLNEEYETEFDLDFADIENALKALEIIKAIGVFNVFEDAGDNYYLETMVAIVGLMKEDYDLLKEVINDE